MLQHAALVTGVVLVVEMMDNAKVVLQETAVSHTKEGGDSFLSAQVALLSNLAKKGPSIDSEKLTNAECATWITVFRIKSHRN